jgi:flagellar L-ring protein precursor FlgH
MKKMSLLLQVMFVLLPAAGLDAKDNKPPKPKEISPLDQYVADAMSRPSQPSQNGGSPGSLWSATAILSDMARDLRASRTDDLVTILVTENVNATSTGDTKTSRQSALQASITSLLGPKSATGALANLANLSTTSSLNGQGATSRQTVLTTNLSARVTHVLPNGYLVVEGHKDTLINSEKQVITVRGVVRPADLDPTNTVSSDRLAQLELLINGKGVVGDAIRRPNIVYRILMGLLPF